VRCLSSALVHGDNEKFCVREEGHDLTWEPHLWVEAENLDPGQGGPLVVQWGDDRRPRRYIYGSGEATRADLTDRLPALSDLLAAVAVIRERGGAGATEQRRLLDAAKELARQYDALP
jgi:hypothetical protein